jgi:lactate dehydrogenase-like 2-hydroxyacid dehydrogenase
MQAHSAIINTLRDEVIDKTALINALDNHQVYAATSDVYENEPVIPKALSTLPNVTLLPHMGTSVLEVKELMEMVVIDSLRPFIAGKPIPNAVSN